MFSLRSVTVLLFLILGLCDAENNNTDNIFKFFEKCRLNDGDCQKNVLETLMQKYAETGVPELSIPPMDPFKVENTTVSVLGMVDMTMVNGIVEGTTRCLFKKFETDTVKQVVSTESFCERITMAGHYKIQAGPFVKPLTGNSVGGEGNGEIQIDKMTLKMRLPYYVMKTKENNDVFLVPKISAAEYSTDDIEKITFKADNVTLGNQEVSNQLMGYMNNNWQLILKSFGRYFSDKMMDVFYSYVEKFFLEVPAKYYISDVADIV